jgi:ubiquitin-conjugating enzyme E2 S
LYTSIHAKPKNKSKSGAISESTTALNVDQCSASFSENAPFAVPTTALSTSSVLTRAFGTNLQDQNATVSDPAVGASAARKDGPMTSKIPVDKKMDARKKSLKRL